MAIRLTKGREKLFKFNFFNIMPQGYCVKCKAKQEMKDAKEIIMKGKGGIKRKAMTGVCPKCGTKMFKIMGKV